MIPKISSAPSISFTLDLLMTRISLDHNTSCPKYICALIKNSPPNGFCLRFFAWLEPPTSCSQTHVLAFCSFRYAPSGAFLVLFGTLVPTVSMWFSSVCGRRCGQKMSSPEKVPFSACRERIRFAYCSLGFSGCQVNVSTFSDK